MVCVYWVPIHLVPKGINNNGLTIMLTGEQDFAKPQKKKRLNVLNTKNKMLRSVARCLIKSVEFIVSCFSFFVCFPRALSVSAQSLYLLTKDTKRVMPRRERQYNSNHRQFKLFIKSVRNYMYWMLWLPSITSWENSYALCNFF